MGKPLGLDRRCSLAAQQAPGSATAGPGLSGRPGGPPSSGQRAVRCLRLRSDTGRSPDARPSLLRGRLNPGALRIREVITSRTRLWGGLAGSAPLPFGHTMLAANPSPGSDGKSSAELTAALQGRNARLPDSPRSSHPRVRTGMAGRRRRDDLPGPFVPRGGAPRSRARPKRWSRNRMARWPSTPRGASPTPAHGPACRHPSPTRLSSSPAGSSSPASSTRTCTSRRR